MRGFVRSAAAAFILFVAGAGSGALADPPARVGRVSLIEGEVTFHDTAEREAAPATLNWPGTGGAALSTAPGARAEVRIGSTAVRLDGATALEFVQVDDDSIRLRLGYGAVALRVRSRELARALVVETRDARVSPGDAGRYRVEAGRAPDTTAVTAFDGSAQVDADGIAIAVQPGRRAEVGPGGRARVVAAFTDGFDDWTFALDRRDDDAVRGAPHYVSPETTGYESLDQYGEWRQTPDYGPVWMPRAVPAGWAPYRTGRWAWIAPWGWTWVDEAPWGFAPFHYGRWALIGGVWGWVPGAFVARPVYAPALVGWVGRPGWSIGISIGAVPAVGWFPLAPREVFVPPYRCSTAYVRNVNVTHVTNVVNITNVPPRHYAYRHAERALTVVPAAAVAGGRPVGRAAVRARRVDVVADAGASNAPPSGAGRPPRQFGAPRRDDDERWMRRAQPVAASPAPQVRQAPHRPPQPQGDRGPDAGREMRGRVAPAPPAAVEREPRQGERQRDREPPAPPRVASPVLAATPPAAAERAPRRTEPFRRPEQRVDPQRAAPSPALPIVTAPPIQPRAAVPQPPRERFERREAPRPVPRAPAPVQLPAVVRTPAPPPPPPPPPQGHVPVPPPQVHAPKPPPEVRALAAPPAPTARPEAHGAPRPEPGRGQPRVAQRGERRGG